MRRSKCGAAVRSALVTAIVLPGLALAETEIFVLEEIIVTARKMSESVQDVPLSITTVSSSMINDLQIKDLSDISKITAGLIFDNEFSRVSDRPVIRGQGTILGDSGVSYFIDGVYIPGTLAGYDLNQIERVEVIKGPQSALYGRNTYSGAINMITKSPGQEFGADIKVEAAEDDQYEVSGAVRGPLIDGLLAGSLSGRYYERDGVFDNKFDGEKVGEQESQSVAGVLEITPGEDLTIRARAYYAELDDGQPGLFSQPASENNCFPDNGSLYNGLGRYFCGELKPRDVDSDWKFQAPNAQDKLDTLQTSLQVIWDIDDRWTLTSITGYNEEDYTMISEADYSATSFQTANFTPNGFPVGGFPDPPFDYAYVGDIVDFTFSSESDSDDFSQEFRLNYEGDRWRALGGVYYFDGSEEGQDNRVLPEGAQDVANANYFAEFARMQGVCANNPVCGSMTPFFGPTIAAPSRNKDQLDTENKAVFGLIGFDVTDTVNITAEVRYQEEDIDQTVTLQDLGGPVTGFVKADESFDSTSPRFTVNWQFTDDSMLYVLYAEGTKPGGFNSATAIEAGVPSFDEEEVESWEIGMKNVLDDGRMIANFAAFYNELDGYQLSQNVRSGGSLTSATVNAGDAEIYGVEAQWSWYPAALDGLILRANYAWTDTEFTDGVDANQGLLNDVADNGLVDCSIGDQFPEEDGCTSLYGSIEGNEIPRSAEHQFYADVEYRRDWAGSDWEWHVGVDYSYEESKYAQVMNLIETGDTELVSARAGIANDRYSFTVWGKNLTGEDSPTLVLRYADGGDSFKRNFVGMNRRDTYYGATFMMNF